MPFATEQEMLVFLSEHSLAYEYIQHPPVFTCEQADLYRPKLPAVSTKNLFLRDKHGSYFLVMTDCNKKLDLKLLGLALHAAKLHFASAERLHDVLCLTPGAVTVLGLINDTTHQVQLWIDQEIWYNELFLCHPLVNTATLTLTRSTLERFFQITGHKMNLATM